MTLVMKFGGTSVGSAEAMRQTAELIEKFKADWGSVVVVASAMGSKPVKVTDLLLNGSQAALKGDLAEVETLLPKLRAIHFDAIEGLVPAGDKQDALKVEIDGFLTHYGNMCQAISFLGEISPRASDAIGGMGEQMSIRILAAYMSERGTPAEAIDATELIVTDDNFTSATPLVEQTNDQTAARLLPLIESGVTPIVTGFIAATADGVTTTLGRGGSDYSGSLIGRAIHAAEVWIWTDVDGVMSTDPRMVPDARTIPELTYREVSELAFYGAKVLHPRTMRPVMESGIPLRIKNTFNPEHPGTVILKERDIAGGNIRAVTAIRELSLITVEGRGMLGIPGVAARTFKAVADTKASVLLITQSSSEQSICFAVPQSYALEITHALESEFSTELKIRDIDRIFSHDDVAIITVVGAGMQGTPGVSGRFLGALGESRVNIIAIAQGSSECSISAVVRGSEVETGIQYIHKMIVNQ
ncbi:MAG: aspartokinase/homoserine dehydrogenase 1 [Cellvibrionaceae bacterium]|jgi:aspartokinase/homoserine dehydrogenase 1